MKRISLLPLYSPKGVGGVVFLSFLFFFFLKVAFVAHLHCLLSLKDLLFFVYGPLCFPADSSTPCGGEGVVLLTFIFLPFFIFSFLLLLTSFSFFF